MNITDDERRELLDFFEDFLDMPIPGGWEPLFNQEKSTCLCNKIRRLIEEAGEDDPAPEYDFSQGRRGKPPATTITRDGVTFCRYCGTALGGEEGTDTASGGKEK